MSLHGVTRAESARRARTREAGARRRAREKAARTDVRRLTLDEVYAKFNGYCFCGRPVDREEASIDHEKPLAEGGVDDETNQRLAHVGCNSSKGARTEPRKKGLRRSMWRRQPKSKIPEGSDVF